MASSSSSSSLSFINEWKYDVFISFRGIDTRSGFTGSLHRALRGKEIKSFMDDQDLQKGAEINPALDEAIKNSRIALVILSKNYASSTFCLDELEKIMDCSKDKGMFVLPVFYEVEHSDVRYQKGKYADALNKHEARIIEKKKIEKWRVALTNIANFSGWHFNRDRYEYELIDIIVQDIIKKIHSLRDGENDKIICNVDDKYVTQHDKRLHEENEKLLDRLTEKASLAGSPQLSSPLSLGSVNAQPRDMGRNDTRNNTTRSMNVLPSPLAADKNDGTVAVVKSGSEIVKTTPAVEYLTTELNDFDPDQYEGQHAAISDGANKLLLLVLHAYLKAGASREHEILAEIKDAVFSFIRKMEPKRVMDTMLVSRVRILYIRYFFARSAELQSIKVLPVECFLEKANTGRSRSSSRGNSPGRSPVQYVGEQIHGFKVNLKPEKKFKFSSIVLKIRGIVQDIWRQQVTGGKLGEITEEAKSFAVGNKALAALFVHTPTFVLQRQIISWLAENFDFLSVTGNDGSKKSTGQLELLSTAIIDGWISGLGAALPPHTDALGQILFEYSKRVYTSQLQYLKDISGTLATEEAEDAAQVAKLRSALESVDHKRKKIMQQIRSDVALLTLENGGSHIQNPSTAAEDSRLASLISLDGILKQIKDITRLSSVNILSTSKKRTMIASLDELREQMPSLLEIDHPCAQRQIADARHMVESIPEEDDRIQDLSHARMPSSTDPGSGSKLM